MIGSKVWKWYTINGDDIVLITSNELNLSKHDWCGVGIGRCHLTLITYYNSALQKKK